MSKKQEQQFGAHCGTIIPLKDGKGTCPKCHKPIKVTYEIGEAPKKPTHKKKPFEYTVSGDVSLYGALFIVLGVFCYAMYMAGQLWVVAVCATLYLTLRLIFSGKKKKA